MASRAIFRKFDNGDIIAVFPHIREGVDGERFLGYMKDGRHVSADGSSIMDTTPATPDEFAPLFKELVENGWTDLKSTYNPSYHI